MQSVITTSVFERQAKAAGLNEADVMEIVAWLAENPRAGDVMPGTGGARKVRFPGNGKGKSGGYRTIHFFGGDDVPIFLLALIDKGQRANLSKAERNQLAYVLSTLADEYRLSVSAEMMKPKGSQ